MVVWVGVGGVVQGDDIFGVYEFLEMLFRKG